MLNQFDRVYNDLVEVIIENGEYRDDRTGTGTKSIFGYQMKFDLSYGFPLLTTKKINFKNIAIELLWFISGSTNTKFLTDNDVNIWNEWVDSNGDLGPVYGWQWFKQLDDVIEQIETNPTSRRLIVDCWQLDDLPKMALPPCHMMYQFYVSNNILSLQVYQRSADVFLGLPYNIASYAMLLRMVAVVTGLVPGTLTHTLGDAHIYNNHMDQIKIQMTRESYAPPWLSVSPFIENIHDFEYKDFRLIGYTPHEALHGKVAV